MKNKKNGFTLIELLAVIIILAIVALIATPSILDVVEDAKISAGKSEANMILSGINNYCASEDMNYQLDNTYNRICTSNMNIENVKKMVNLGNAEILEIIYNGEKITTLIIESNNHKFTLCPSGTFVMDDEKCEVIHTGSIANVVLSNFPYLETNGNGCITPTSNNYSYMGGCYLKGDGLSGKNKFYLIINQMGIDNDTITKTFFDEEGNFIEENFNNWFNDFASQQGMTEEDIKQMLEEEEVDTVFELLMIEVMGYPITPKELFIQQSLNNNLLWYSGFLWRIMGINADGTVRMITDENVTSIPWGNTGTAEKWDESHPKEWLNNYFYQRLKGNDIIVEQIWCSESTTSNSSARTDCTNNLSVDLAYVGLMTLDEYNLAGGSNSYLNIGQDQLTLTPYDKSFMWIVDSYGNFSGWRVGYYSSNVDYYTSGLRAIINVESNVIITSGNGIVDENWSVEEGPYILNEDKSIEVTGKLNQISTSGEYVLFSGKKYRVVDKDSDGNTKLILDGYYKEDENIFEMKYNEFDNVFSTTTGIGQKLNSDILEWLAASDDTENRNKLVTNYIWYQKEFSAGNSYKVSLDEEHPTRSINATVGLIRIGEMLSSQSSSILTKGYTTPNNYNNAITYWTMTPNNYKSNAWIVRSNGYAKWNNVSYEYGLRPVIVIKSDVTITGGNGTWSNPYKI